MGRLEYHDAEGSMVDPQREQVVNALFGGESFFDDSENDAIREEEEYGTYAAPDASNSRVSQSMQFRQRIRSESRKNAAVEDRAQSSSNNNNNNNPPAEDEREASKSGAQELADGGTVSGSSCKAKSPPLQRQLGLGAQQSRVGAVAVIPAGGADDYENLYVEDDFEREENPDDVSIDSKSVMDTYESNVTRVLPEATVIPASLVEREEEAERQLYMLKREMEDKQQEMAAVREKLAQMERMEKELQELRSALAGKVTVAELVKDSSSAEATDPGAKLRRNLVKKQASSTKRLDPQQVKAAAAAMAPEDRKKMKEKGMDVVDFMVYQSLVRPPTAENKQREGKATKDEPIKSVCDVRKNGLSQRSNRFSSLRMNKQAPGTPGSSEMTDFTVLMDDYSSPVSGSSRSLFDPVSYSARSLGEYRSDDDQSQSRSMDEQVRTVEETSPRKLKFKNPVRKLYLKVMNKTR